MITPAYFNIPIIKLDSSEVSNWKLLDVPGLYSNCPKEPGDEFHAGTVGSNIQLIVTKSGNGLIFKTTFLVVFEAVKLYW